MSEPLRACSLSPAEQVGRGEEFRALARRALDSRERRDGAVVLSFRPEPGVHAAVEDLAVRERECCPFLDLDVTERDGLISLTIAAAPDDAPALDAFYELAR